MQKLPDTYKVEIATKFTELAIENELISCYKDSEDTAREVCKFFQYVVENLDN